MPLHLRLNLQRDQWATFITSWFKFLLFDLIWARASSFTGMSLTGTWVNMFLMALLFAMPFLAFRSRRWQIVVFFLLDLLLVSNLMYSRTYYGMIPAESYLMVGNLAGFEASVIDSLRWIDILFPASTIMLWLLYRRWHNISFQSPTRVYWWSLGMLLVLSLANTFYYKGFNAHYDYLTSYKYHAARPLVFTVPGLIIHDIIQAREPLTPQMKQEVQQYIAQTPPLPALSPDSTRTNLVLIICESLESWVVDAKVEGKQVTPYLHSLAHDSTTLFLNRVMSQVDGARSMDCQLMVNAGLLPLKSGAFSLLMPDNQFFTLSKAMKQMHGTRNYIVTTDKPNNWNQGEMAKSFGIDTLVHYRNFTHDQKVGVHGNLGDESLLRQTVSKLQSRQLWPVGQKSFFQVVTYSGHNPFKLEPRYDQLNLKGKYPSVLGDYMTMAHFTDRSLKPFVEYIRSRPDYPNTLVVIMGDHEGLADYRRDISSSLPQELESVRGRIQGNYVPVIILNSPYSGTLTDEIGQIDLYPALLQLMGLTDYRWHGLGESFLTGKPIGPDPTRCARARNVSDHILRHDMLSDHPK